ncbi:GNAT family N-acetyltransferase [Actinoplanes sp. DH11]|uniref:GNAT family N-acetyltransferase n=1 Tax=Actinoplanes sp. DH11 TaxID=2857011 RepID=UPI001E327E91|nr:GNAT family N-acetyltransferase [Actinoplanes sp. DH11]
MRRFTAGDLADFLAYQADPVVRRHLPGEPMNPAEAAGFLTAQAALGEDARDAWHGYAVRLTAGGRVIGDVGVWLSSRPDQADSGDVGFQFHPEFHGLGYAGEAMRLFLTHVFGTLGLQRVTASCDAANAASRALLERLGMRPAHRSGTDLEYGRRRDDWPRA